jgi:hypothetical protein
MRITSTHGKAWVELSRNGSGAHASFSIACSVDTGHGAFSARNSDVHLLNLEEFVKTLDAFVLRRDLIPRLNGTYDTAVTFFRPQDRNAIMVSFAIGDTFSDYLGPMRYRTEGEFEVSGEVLYELVKDFEKLSAAAQPIR